MFLKRLTDTVLDRLVGKTTAKAGDLVCYTRSCGTGGIQRCCYTTSGVKCVPCVYP